MVIVLLLCRSIPFHIKTIVKVRHLLSYDACSTFINAPISCWLDYCSSFLYNHSPLNIIQRAMVQSRNVTKN